MTKTIAFNLRPVQPGQVAENNLIGALFDGKSYEVLMSETSQNSIDAFSQHWNKAHLGVRARLKFTFTSIPASHLEPYGLSTVQAHVDSCTEHTMRGRTSGDLIPVLLMEDFSGGLDGCLDPHVHTVDSPLARYLFAKGTGIDGKKGHSNGRHGLGANTGAAVSKLKMMLVHSSRFDTPTVASGRVSLPTHVLDGRRYSSEARLGVFDDDDWAGILEGHVADEMHDAIGFRRRIDQPGLSCAIIDPVEDLNVLTLAAAAMAGHFFQIMSGDIEYEISDDTGGPAFFLSRETFADALDDPAFAEIRQSVLTRGHPTKIMRILEDLPRLIGFVDDFLAHESFPVVSEDQPLPDSVRLDWLSGRPVICSLNAAASHVEKGDVTGSLKIYAVKSEDDQPCFDIRVRDSIVNVEHKNADGRLCIVYSAKDDISVLLGDAEDASHREYKKTNAASRGWMGGAAETISQFMNAGSTLQKLLTGGSDRDDLVSLAKFFPMPGELFSDRGKGGAETDDPEAPEGEALLPDVANRDLVTHEFDLEAKSITIRPSADLVERWNRGETFNIRIDVDYSLKTSKIGQFADTTGRIAPATNGCEKYTQSGSRLEAFNVNDEFRVDILDVDPNRDIDITFARIDDETDLEDAA